MYLVLGLQLTKRLNSMYLKCTKTKIVSVKKRGSWIPQGWKKQNATILKFESLNAHILMATCIINNHLRVCHKYVHKPSNLLNFNDVTKILSMKCLDNVKFDISRLKLIVKRMLLEFKS